MALSPEDTVEEAIRLIRERAIRRIPVVDRDGKVAGVVSINDLVRHAAPGSARATNGLSMDQVFTVLSVQNSVASRVSYGGTAPANVRAQAEAWRKRLEKDAISG